MSGVNRDRQTDGRTDRRTDGQTDGRTDVTAENIIPPGGGIINCLKQILLKHFEIYKIIQDALKAYETELKTLSAQMIRHTRQQTLKEIY